MSTPLPPGLGAVALEGPGDHLDIYVSDALRDRQQRAAAMQAIRAWRPPSRWVWLAASGVALLAAIPVWLLRAAVAPKARFGWAAAAAAAASVELAFVLTAPAPLPHGRLAASPPRIGIMLPHRPRVASPVPGQRRQADPRRRARPSSPLITSLSVGRPAGPAPSRLPAPVPGPSTTPPSTAPPSPPGSPSPSPRPPSPTPSPSSGHRVCVRLLLLRVCL